MPQELACSERVRSYFTSLSKEADRCYGVARRARARGMDPEVFVEIPQAEDLASRVEKLLAQWNVEGVASRIRELSRDHNREEVSLLIAREVASRPSKTKEEAIDRAVRVGLAVLTEGILVAPLEGIAGIKLGRNSDGSSYLSISFAGPIRSAGGTGQAMAVLIGDVVRREHGIGKFVPTHGEVQRFKEEIPLYKQAQHLQYTPTNAEIELIVKNCPVCVDGEGTEEVEISGYRDLPRVETNKVRGGACLVIAEGLCQKANKLEKHVKKLGIDGWEFISEYLAMKKKDVAEGEAAKVKPEAKYLKDLIAGRPVLGHPSRVGGLRLRYGRGRTTGLAAIALNPATMYAVDSFLAIGTQIKIERPGKAGAVTPCDEIDGPILLLSNGDVVRTNTVPEYESVKDRVKEIIDLGEILVPFGEFVENNHVLVPAGFTMEWYRAELKKAAITLPADWERPMTFDRALALSREYGVPLHPDFNLFWSDVPLAKLTELRAAVLESGRAEGPHFSITNVEGPKRTLEDLGALHTVADGRIVFDDAAPLLAGLGLRLEAGKVVSKGELEGSTSLEAVSQATGVQVRAKAVTRIGARMARPEKAKERRMKPPPHVLFPLGQSGGAQRLVSEAMEGEEVHAEVGIRSCPVCGKSTFLCRCECGSHTLPTDAPAQQVIDINSIIDAAMRSLGLESVPAIKGVQGMISHNKTPEPMEKGILRAQHGTFVFKDGTIRFDMT
ncbi:MAG TPA: DNA polymerase II large subunit, partial [Methanomassiliicoccales archaeon]|nr:DNA polymerase II large subunit [Methanomassiliicoccales archaeon]